LNEGRYNNIYMNGCFCLIKFCQKNNENNLTISVITEVVLIGY
jgi:hypothetical protein